MHPKLKALLQDVREVHLPVEDEVCPLPTGSPENRVYRGLIERWAREHGLSTTNRFAGAITILLPEEPTSHLTIELRDRRTFVYRHGLRNGIVCRECDRDLPFSSFRRLEVPGTFVEFGRTDTCIECEGRGAP